LKKKLLVLLLLFFAGWYLQGCITVETKEYRLTLKSGYSGEGKIKYINIMRSEDSLGTIESDYNGLIDDYLNGNKPEDEFLGVKKVKKRLFEEDNKLCGEMTFEFDDITKIRFYNYDNKVWAYYIAAISPGIFAGSETYFSSNGTYAGESFPVVFWNNDQKVFELKTSLAEPSKNNISLLELWKSKGNE